MADRDTCERIATEMRRLDRDHPRWYLVETIGALIDAGIIQPGVPQTTAVREPVDPDAALANLRGYINRWITNPGGLTEQDVTDMIDQCDALDQWLTTGGKLPGGWSRPPAQERNEEPHGS
jgi:hypothetical protein